VYSGNLPTSEAAAITGSDYISFTITPTSGTLSYSSVFFNIDVEAFENATAFTAVFLYGRASMVLRRTY